MENDARSYVVADEVRARRFAIVDEEDNVRGWLAAPKGCPGLSFCDEKMKPRILLAVGDDGPTLHLMNKDGETCLRFFLNDESETAGVGLSDKNGDLCAGLIAVKGIPGLTMADQDGTIRLALINSREGPSLTLYDEEGQKVWSTRQQEK